MRASRGLALFIVLGVATAAAFGASVEDQWPTWRGPTSDGIASKGDPPITWSETENIKWKIEIPGISDSTPIVWGDKMFIQTAVATGEEPPPPEAPAGERRRRRRPTVSASPTVPHQFKLLCYNRHTGELLWDRTVREEIPHEGHHPSSSHSSYSPVTDGEFIWMSFGSRGLHCYDLDGNPIWSTDLFQMKTRNAFGEGSSPALAGDAIVVTMDNEEISKVAAYNKNTGKLIWENEREEPTSWSTPMPVEVDGRLQVVISATNMIRSYDVETGELIWECSGQTLNAIPSPVFGFGNVYCTSGYAGASLQAINLHAKGDVSDSDAIVWHVEKDTPYVASPLLYGDTIYVTRGLGSYISAYKAETGRPLYQRVKLEGMKTIYSSPVGVAGRIYLSDRVGHTMVLKHGDAFEVIAMNTLDDGFDASPVVIGDTLYLKGAKFLYCIEEL